MGTRKYKLFKRMEDKELGPSVAALISKAKHILL